MVRMVHMQGTFTIGGSMHSITLLNRTGDVTISWDEASKEKIIAFIRKKMNERVTFFIVEECMSMGKVTVATRSKLTDTDINTLPPDGQVVWETNNDVSAMRELAKVYLDDQEAEALVTSGAAHVVPTVSGTPIRRAKTPEEAANHRTIAVPRVVGG